MAKRLNKPPTDGLNRDGKLIETGYSRRLPTQSSPEHEQVRVMGRCLERQGKSAVP